MVKKKKLKNGIDLYITKKDTSRYILRDGETATLTNQSGVEFLLTMFPSVHHE